jgi:prolyl 4-hydroxylase
MAPPSLVSLLQYAVLGLVGYVLAGAPLLSILFGSSSKKHPSQQFTGDQSDSLVVPDQNLSCPFHGYNVHLFSHEPLVLYLAGFLSDEEAEHVVRMRYENYSSLHIFP